MKILDRIALLRAGYTKSEIEKMIEEDSASAIEIPVPAESVKEEKSPDPVEEKNDDPVIDYKALYEKEKAEKEALQRDNINRNNFKEKEDDSALIKDIVCSFL